MQPDPGVRVFTSLFVTSGPAPQVNVKKRLEGTLVHVPVGSRLRSGPGKAQCAPTEEVTLPVEPGRNYGLPIAIHVPPTLPVANLEQRIRSSRLHRRRDSVRKSSGSNRESQCARQRRANDQRTLRPSSRPETSTHAQITSPTKNPPSNNQTKHLPIPRSSFSSAAQNSPGIRGEYPSFPQNHPHQFNNLPQNPPSHPNSPCYSLFEVPNV